MIGCCIPIDCIDVISWATESAYGATSGSTSTSSTPILTGAGAVVAEATSEKGQGSRSSTPPVVVEGVLGDQRGGGRR